MFIFRSSKKENGKKSVTESQKWVDKSRQKSIRYKFKKFTGEKIDQQGTFSWGCVLTINPIIMVKQQSIQGIQLCRRTIVKPMRILYHRKDTVKRLLGSHLYKIHTLYIDQLYWNSQIASLDNCKVYFHFKRSYISVSIVLTCITCSLYTRWQHGCKTMSQQGSQACAICCDQQCCNMLRWHVVRLWPPCYDIVVVVG